MIGAIIGDVVGSRYEWHNHKSKDFELFGKKCRPTDDSVMSLAIAKAILECDGDYKELSQKAIECMQEFGRIYKDAGYGGSFIKWLWEDDPHPYNSYGNGSAMRVGPCGYAAQTIEEAKELSEKVSMVTHNHPEGLKGAEAVSVAIFLARTGKNKDEIREYIRQEYYDIDFTIDQLRETYKFDVSCQGSVPVALEAFFESYDFEDAIRTAVSVGGDSDTIAAITGSIAEAYYGVPEEIIYYTIDYLDGREMETLYYFEEKYVSKALDEDGEQSRTIFETLDDAVDRVIPAGTTIEVDEVGEGGVVHAWVEKGEMRPDFSAFDKHVKGKGAKELLEKSGEFLEKSGSDLSKTARKAGKELTKAGIGISKGAKKLGAGIATVADSVKDRIEKGEEKPDKEERPNHTKKNKMIFQSIESLQPVVNVVNEAAFALNDGTRTIRESAIPEVLFGALGAGVGSAGSFAALYGLGTVGLSAVGISTALATAGSIVGGGMVAGIFVLAAPVAALAAGGVGMATHLKNKQLKQEKERLYQEVLRKHDAIIKALKDEVDANKERMEYLTSLNTLLTHALNDLKADLGKA